MPDPSLPSLLREFFPDAVFDAGDPALGPGSFAEWDSLAHFNFLMLVEETYGVRFPMEELPQLTSLAAIAAALARHGIA